jgi:hypothetical protein
VEIQSHIFSLLFASISLWGLRVNSYPTLFIYQHSHFTGVSLRSSLACARCGREKKPWIHAWAHNSALSSSRCFQQCPPKITPNRVGTMTTTRMKRASSTSPRTLSRMSASAPPRQPRVFEVDPRPQAPPDASS